MPEMKKYNHPSYEDESLPRILTEIGKDMPFSVPDNYFEALPGQILQRIHSETKSASRKVILPLSIPARYYVAAAVIAGILFLTAAIWHSYSLRLRQSSSVWAEYLISHSPEYFDEEMIYQMMEKDQFAVLPADDAVSRYLMENETDVQLILLEDIP